jgi:acyl-coenzyme A thioesterase PaaI-like protein
VTALPDRLAAAKAAGDPALLVEAVPYARFLGLTAALAAPGAAPDGAAALITTMRFAPALIGNAGLPALHGGTLGALLESAAVFELLWRAETIVVPKTITITVDYLRSAATVDTHARAMITRHGRRVANVRIEAWQADRAAPVASAHAMFLVMREA